MPLKVPPPPPIANQDPAFNRWLLELTAILNASGGIDTNSVVGLPGVIAQSAANTAAITALQATTAGQGGSIGFLQSEVSTLQGNVVTINGQLTTLGARNQILNGTGAPGAGLGNNGDLYIDNNHPATNRLYAKIAAAWLTIV